MSCIPSTAMTIKPQTYSTCRLCDKTEIDDTTLVMYNHHHHHHCLYYYSLSLSFSRIHPSGGLTYCRCTTTTPLLNPLRQNLCSRPPGPKIAHDLSPLEKEKEKKKTQLDDLFLELRCVMNCCVHALLHWQQLHLYLNGGCLYYVILTSYNSAP